MPHLNADIPQFDCWLRTHFLYDGRTDLAQDAFARVTVFGLASIAGRALGFHVLVHETGAVIWRLPIHALASFRDARGMPLDHLQLWDCFSYDVAVTEFEHLSGRRCLVLIKDGSKIEGEYLFTVDWCGNAYSENAGDSGHKCAHVIELDNGSYAAQPNNRILWADPAVIPEPFKTVPDYKTNTSTWKCESTGRWATGDDDRMFYEVMEPGGAKPAPEEQVAAAAALARRIGSREEGGKQEPQEPQPTETVNFNKYVWVRLTDHGRTILRNHDRPESCPNEDADGWSRWRLWELMQLFGPHLSIAGDLPFEVDLRL